MTTVPRPIIRVSFITSIITELLSTIKYATVSAKPTTYIATATAFANEKIRPIEPPNSGPKLREMR
jgi:hypothetical protein